MSPKELKTKHQLTYSQLAVILHKDIRTVERYCGEAKYPEYLDTYCYLLDFYLQSSGTLPPTVWGMSQ